MHALKFRFKDLVDEPDRLAKKKYSRAVSQNFPIKHILNSKKILIT